MYYDDGQTIDGRYRVVRRLGEGSCGVVYLVESTAGGGGPLVLKLVRDTDEGMRERFAREMEAARRLSHPSIVSIREFSTAGEHAWVAMDWVDGPTLRDIIRRERYLSNERAVARTRDILEALGAAHAAGMVHRDVKPGNVLLADVGTENERARVFDFGIALVVAGASPEGGIAGSPAYMAPEHADATLGPVGERADIYSTGCVLFEMLTGEKPFLAENLAGYVALHRSAPVPLMLHAAPDRRVPGDLEAVVRRAMAKDPEDRFASAREMVAALDRVRDAALQTTDRLRAILPPRPRGRGE